MGSDLNEQADKHETRQEHKTHRRQIVESFCELFTELTTKIILAYWAKVVDNSPLPHSVTEKVNLDFKFSEDKLSKSLNLWRTAL